MKKYYITIFLMLMGCCLPVFAEVYETTPDTQIYINEILAGTTQSASQEFIELYNLQDHSVVLTGWKIQYSSSGLTNWDNPTRTITLSGEIAPKAYFLLTTSGYLIGQANATYSATLSQAGGNLRLVSDAGVTKDQIGWGTGKIFSGQPAPASESGQVLARHSFASSIELANNADDFEISNQPTPGLENIFDLPQETSDQPSTTENTQTDPQPVEIQEPNPEPQTEMPEEEEPIPNSVPITYLAVEITELLPNPAPPKTDSENEFVEIFNPNSEVVNLKGYVLATGVSDNYKMVLGDIIINPGQYLVLTSAESNLTLSNASGQAKLYDPLGNLLSQSSIYEDAKDDQAWVVAEGVWGWTLTITPGAANIVSSAPIPQSTQKAKTSTKKSTAKKTSTKTSTKKSTVSSKSSSQGQSDISPEPATRQNVHPLVLAGVGSLVILYGLYEYRFDMANYLRKLKPNRKTGLNSGRNSSAPLPN